MFYVFVKWKSRIPHIHAPSRDFFNDIVRKNHFPSRLEPIIEILRKLFELAPKSHSCGGAVNTLFCILNENYLEWQAHIQNPDAPSVDAHSLLIVFGNKRQIWFSICPKGLHGSNPLGPLRVKQFGAQRSTFFIIFFYFLPISQG